MAPISSGRVSTSVPASPAATPVVSRVPSTYQLHRFSVPLNVNTRWRYALEVSPRDVPTSMPLRLNCTVCALSDETHIAEPNRPPITLPRLKIVGQPSVCGAAGSFAHTSALNEEPSRIE